MSETILLYPVKQRVYLTKNMTDSKKERIKTAN